MRSGILVVFLRQSLNKSKPNGLICHGGAEARIDLVKFGPKAARIYDKSDGIRPGWKARKSTAEWGTNVQVNCKRPRKPLQADHGVSANSSHHHTPEPEIGQQEAASEEVGRMVPDFGVEARAVARSGFATSFRFFVGAPHFITSTRNTTMPSVHRHFGVVSSAFAGHVHRRPPSRASPGGAPSSAFPVLVHRHFAVVSSAVGFRFLRFRFFWLCSSFFPPFRQLRHFPGDRARFNPEIWHHPTDLFAGRFLLADLRLRGVVVA